MHQGPLTSQACHQGPVTAGVGVDQGLADKYTAFRFHTRTNGFNFFLALAGHSRLITGTRWSGRGCDLHSRLDF